MEHDIHCSSTVYREEKLMQNTFFFLAGYQSVELATKLEYITDSRGVKS